MKLSIVSTLFKSESTILEFCERCRSVAKESFGDSYEIILVNDGSPDESLSKAIEAAKKDSRIKIIDLSRNFGHHKAMMTGLVHSNAELVFLIDSDLEEEPEYLKEFHNTLNKENADVVYGVQKTRKGNFFEKISGSWFYVFFRLLTGLALPTNIVTARLMKRGYVHSLTQHQEREIFMAGLWHITGFKQVPYTIKKHNTSQSTYTLLHKFKLVVNSVTSFSNSPLIGIFYIGVTISSIAFIYIFSLITRWVFFAKPLAGWTSVMASIWLIGGMIISFIGIVGIYVSKIFSEVKQRPYTIIKQVYEFDSQEKN